MTKIIFLNGPSGCGKTYGITQIIKEFPDFAHMKMSAPLQTMAAAILGDTVEALEKKKDTSIAPFGMSFRETQIMVWQEIAHGLGEAWLGHSFVLNAEQLDEDVIIVGDCGRSNELLPIVRRFGSANCLVIQIAAQGQVFSNDIRGYISGPMQMTAIFNDRTPRFITQLRDIVTSFVAGTF